MAKDSTPLEDLKTNVERAVEQTMEQTRGTLDNYFNFMKKAFSSYPFGGAELGEKLKTYTERNIAAAEKFIQKLSHAKDFQDIIRIQTEFMQTQFEALASRQRVSPRHLQRQQQMR